MWAVGAIFDAKPPMKQGDWTIPISLSIKMIMDPVNRSRLSLVPSVILHPDAYLHECTPLFLSILRRPLYGNAGRVQGQCVLAAMRVFLDILFHLGH